MIKTMNDTIESLRPLFNRVNWSDDRIYGLWLSQAYYIAKRSTSFLGLTMIHSHPYPEFLARCTDHISEETGHEKLILNDLKNLDLPLSAELPSTSAIYQTQYYRVVAENALSFVGYIFLLELLAPAFGPLIMDRCSNKKAITFLRVHASADEDHIGEATKILETMDNRTREMALSNFQMTAASYRQLLETLVSQQSSQLKSA